MKNTLGFVEWVNFRIFDIPSKIQTSVSCVEVIIVIHGRPPVAVSAAMHNIIGGI